MTVAAPSANGANTASRPAAPRASQMPPTALELIRSADRTHADATSAPAAPHAASSSDQGFSPEQLAALAAPLDRAKVRQREQGRSKVHYLEGWQVFVEANRIFGFDRWRRQTLAVRCVNQAERLIGRDQKTGWGVTNTARCASRSLPAAARPWFGRAVAPAMASMWTWARPMNRPSRRPTFWDRWSRRLEITSGELLPDQPVPLLKRRWELSREEALRLWAEKRQQCWQACSPQWALSLPGERHPRDGLESSSMARPLSRPYA